MADKKILKEEEMEEVTGGFNIVKRPDKALEELFNPPASAVADDLVLIDKPTDPIILKNGIPSDRVR